MGWVGWGGGPCDYCVSPSPKNWVLGFFRLLDRILDLLGQGIGDLDSGLTIEQFSNDILNLFNRSHIE